MLVIFSKIDLWNEIFSYLNYLGKCLESCDFPVVVVGAFVTGPFAVVLVPLFGPLLIYKLRINIINFWKTLILLNKMPLLISDKQIQINKKSNLLSHFNLVLNF